MRIRFPSPECIWNEASIWMFNATALLVWDVRRRWGSHKSTAFPHTHNYMDCQAFNFCGCVIFSLRTACVNLEPDLALLYGRAPKQTNKWWERRGKREESHHIVNRLPKCGHYRLPGQLFLSLPPPSSKPHLMICLSLIVTGEQFILLQMSELERLKIKKWSDEALQSDSTAVIT